MSAHVALLALAITACAGAPTFDAPPEPAPPAACESTVESFDAAAIDYAAAHALPRAWVAFEAAQYPRLCLAHDVAAWHRSQGGVRLAVSSCRADVTGAEGEERAAAIEHLLELAFPGLGFSLTWHGAGLPLVLDCPTARGRLDGARVVRDGGAVHEIGHLLGLPHHYPTPAQAGLGLHMWSADETCTEDLTGGLDTACAGALGVELPDREALDAALWALYCAGCARGDVAAAACVEC